MERQVAKGFNMEWWQYYSIVSWILFVVIVLVVVSRLLLGLFVRAICAVGPETSNTETATAGAEVSSGETGRAIGGGCS